MPLKRIVKDIMIPVENYAVIGPDATLQEAIKSLRTSYCQIETGFCTETGPRTILVVDAEGELLGLLDFNTLLKVLIPEISGKLANRLSALEVSVVFAQAGAQELDVSHEGIAARVTKNAQVKVNKIMLKNVASVDSDTPLIEALKVMFRKKLTVLPVYEKGRVIGVVRNVDLFLAAADLVQ
jgi:CBS domain-containing protein